MKSKIKSKLKREVILTSAICLIPMVFGIIVYGKLPAQIPTKWYTDGTVGQYAPKALTVFGLPLFLTVVNLLLHFSLNTDPKKSRQSRILKMICIWICPVLGLFTGSAGILWAQGYKLPIDRVIPMGVGLLFIIIGNYLPKCKQNYTLGIKLPWTLNSEENWNKTHRLAGYIWIAAGLCMILMTFIQRSFPMAINLALLAVLVFLMAVPAGYSYLLYRKGV